MNTYQAHYSRERIEVRAESGYKAQLIAAGKFKTRKVSDVVVILLRSQRPRITSPRMTVGNPTQSPLLAL